MPYQDPEVPNTPVTKAAEGETPIPKGYYGINVVWPITNQRFRALFPITWSNCDASDDELQTANA